MSQYDFSFLCYIIIPTLLGGRVLKNYLSLSILVLFYSFYYFNYDYQQAIDLQNISIIDDQGSDNPVDDSGKLKGITASHPTDLVIILLVITSLVSVFSLLTRRLMLITSIFYQSNYLIHSFE